MSNSVSWHCCGGPWYHLAVSPESLLRSCAQSNQPCACRRSAVENHSKQQQKGTELVHVLQCWAQEAAEQN